MSRESMALGGTMFAAWLLIVAGVWQVLVGIAALVEDEFFVLGLRYAYEFDLTGWGWAHLILGAAAIAIGCTLFTGTDWSRALGVAAAICSMIANFMWLPFQPWWSILVIAADVFITWSLVNVGDRMRFPDTAGR
jgi:hypothetical protein